MSFFPSPVLVRLQELRLWQGNYDSLLQNKSDATANPSDFETIEGISALDSTRSSPLSSPDRNKNVDWDKKTISPSKPFAELLEEKLALDHPLNFQPKPKRPFLKKGTGLTRYKLGQRPATTKTARNKSQEQIKQHERPLTAKIFQNSSHEHMKRDEQAVKKGLSSPIKRKSCLKAALNLKRQPDVTPLKIPDLSIKPKATWRRVLDNEGDNDSVKEEVTKSDDFKPFSNNFNSHIIGKINEFALRHFLPNSPKKNARQNKNKIDSHSNTRESKAADVLAEQQMSSEASMEKELRIFETLEERTEHPSFSSTNSSIIRLLSSTPNKKPEKTAMKSPIVGERKLIHGEDKDFGYCSQHNIELQRKLEEINKKSDVLHDFLCNLRKMGGNDNRKLSDASKESAKKSLQYTPDTSFSDDEKWSSNTEFDRSQSPSSFSTIRGKDDINKKVDAAVNTSFSEKDEVTQSDPCFNCEDLRKKLQKLSLEIPDIQAEKAKVCDFAKDLETKRDQLNKEIEKMKIRHEEDILSLKQELESEKKKLVKEKMVFETYIKDSQNRPNKKEREETSNLKKELSDAKELLKLRDTKNSTTQARLRNQIRQLEKEVSELKTNLEKLQKENSKLTASQLTRRPSEVKMLHEINKNITKLTEETLKKQQNKSDVISNEVVKKKTPRRSSSADENHERDKSPKVKKKQVSFSKIKQAETPRTTLSEISTNDTTSFANLSLEKQYENVFGSSPLSNNSTLNDSKREKTEVVFEDGTKEIKYSNGNTKKISPDGNLVVVKYYNGDIKETNLLKKTLRYFYAQNETWHTQFGDGSELLEYPNGQKERTFKDGKKEITCADGSFLTLLPDGSEEVLYLDGSKIIKNIAGEKVLLLPNGQKEIHTKEHKRREYPDGTVKILFPDGTQETRYASGRIRVKDASGALIMDSLNPVP